MCDKTKEIEDMFERYDDLIHVKKAVFKYGESVVDGIAKGEIKIMNGFVRESEINKYLNK